MYQTPYETAPARGYELEDLKTALEEDLREQRLYQESTRIYFVDDRLQEHKPFAHPLVIEADGIRRVDQAIVADVRASAKYKRETNELSGGVDFEFQRARCHLMDHAWIDGNTRDLLNLSDLPGRIFSTLIGELLARKLTIDDTNRRHIEALAACYYIVLHMNEDQKEELVRDDRNLVGVYRRASRISSIPASDIESYLGEEPAGTLADMGDIDGFVSVLTNRVDTKRIEGLRPSSFYQLSGGVWFGAHATEMIAVAYEHPPTFAAMVYTHIAFRAYPKSIIGQLIKRIDRKRDESSEFGKRVERLISSNVSQESDLSQETDELLDKLTELAQREE